MTRPPLRTWHVTAWLLVLLGGCVAVFGLRERAPDLAGTTEHRLPREPVLEGARGERAARAAAVMEPVPDVKVKPKHARTRRLAVRRLERAAPAPAPAAPKAPVAAPAPAAPKAQVAQADALVDQALRAAVQ